MTIQELREQKMEQALNYYATIADAARALGVHPRTLYRFIEKKITNDLTTTNNTRPASVTIWSA